MRRKEIDRADMKADLPESVLKAMMSWRKFFQMTTDRLLEVRETQEAIFAAKSYIEENLCRELNVMIVTDSLIVDNNRGVNDCLERDGSWCPIGFHIHDDHYKNAMDADIVTAATKWKRVALSQFNCKIGEGMCTDLHAV